MNIVTKIVTFPFITIKQYLIFLVRKFKEYRIEFKYKGKTILTLIILLHWIYGYAYITGSNFYEEYTRVAQAKEINLIGQINGVVAKVPIQEDEVYQSPEQELTTEEIKNEIIKIAEEKEFKWTDYLLRLAKCESNFNIKARNDNGVHGIDRGLFQINTKYHPEVSDECADSLECSTEWTMWRIESGWQSQWVCNDLVLANPNKYNW